MLEYAVARDGEEFEARSNEGEWSIASRLEPTLYDGGGAVALEAGQRAILEIARAAIDAVRRRLGGELVTYMPPADDVRRTVEFLEPLSLETTDTGTIRPGLVRLAHALDHLERLHEDLARAPAPTQAWQPPPGFGEGAQALASWLEATQEPEAVPNAGILDALEKARSAGPCASSCWRTSRSSASARRRRAPASSNSRGRTALSITQRAWRGRCTAKPKSESRDLAPAAPGRRAGARRPRAGDLKNHSRPKNCSCD